MRGLGPVATSALSLFALAESTIRGIDYLRVPPDDIGFGASAIAEWIPVPTLGIVLLVLGLVGMIASTSKAWMPAALVHAFLAGIFLTMGVLCLGPAFVAGYSFRVGFSYIFIFAVVHLVSAGALKDRWWIRRGTRQDRLDREVP